MKRILIDTHVLLWWLNGSSQLGKRTIAMLCDEANKIFVSAASCWEISIKQQKGLLHFPRDIDAIIDSTGFIELPITIFHGQQAGRLPDHHKDPFDRMLIAQAQSEGLDLMTCDSAFPAYGIRLIDAKD